VCACFPAGGSRKQLALEALPERGLQVGRAAEVGTVRRRRLNGAHPLGLAGCKVYLGPEAGCVFTLGAQSQSA